MMISNDNDPELNGKYLGTISSDFIKICENLKEAAYQVRKRGFQNTPYFRSAKKNNPLGSFFSVTGKSP